MTEILLDRALIDYLTDPLSSPETLSTTGQETLTVSTTPPEDDRFQQPAVKQAAPTEAAATTKRLVALTLGPASSSDLRPLLTELMPEDHIVHVGLLDNLTAEEIESLYAPIDGESIVMARLEDGSHLILSAARVEAELQKRIDGLEQQGYETLLLLCSGEYKNLVTRSAALLEPYSLLPPLVEAITAGHQVGIVVAREEFLTEQARKWRSLSQRPHFAVASPWALSDEELIDAALLLQEKGADVVVLDCLGYHQRHRDFLQKLLGIPVVLSNMLIAKLAVELME
ncbi:AroM family protein [Erwinia sp. HDF1-3R]|uniref:AroM family protein n=1 Tax=Erwinia sp. HDF1-3R TaxID=3141543 RepID=UPI0031F54571